MKIPEQFHAYLLGDKYSNGLKFSLKPDAEDFRYHSRIELLEKLCRDKRVVHVGCVDHNIDSIEHKIARGKWLHAELCNSAERCLGVDINADGLRYIRDELGYQDVLHLDITSEAELPEAADYWDYILIPEVLEHLPDPGGFLAQLRRRYPQGSTKFVVTVPNALARDHVAAAKRHAEEINSDHKYVFSPYTLTTLLMRAGFQIEQLRFCRHGRVKRRSILKNWYFRRYPLLRNDMVVVMT